MANRIRGITVEINGDTTGLTKALGGVNSQIKTTESQLKDVEKLLKLDPKNTELLRQKQVLLAQAVSQTSDKVKTLHEAEKQLADNGVDENSEQFMGLRREIIEAENALDNYKAAQTGTGAATKDATGSLKLFSAEMVTAVGKASALAAGVVALGKKIASFSLETAAKADDIITQSSITGLSTSRLQELEYAAPFVDTDVDTITGALTRNIRSMSSAQSGSGSAYEAYEKLGISVTDAAGKLRNSETVFWEALEALKNVGNETDRDAIAMELFGRSAQNLNPLIEAGRDRLNELAAEAHAVGYVMDTETLTKMGELQDEADKTKLSLKTLLQELGIALGPGVSSALEYGLARIDQFQNESFLGKIADVASSISGNRVINMARKALSGNGIAESELVGGTYQTNVNITFTGDNAAIARALEPEITAETVRKGAGTAR